MSSNQDAYSSAKTVGIYASHEALQKGELSIFTKFTDRISHGRVLDIGIGGGRTTAHLVSMAGEYVGVDFSRPFVAHCQSRFGTLPHVTIQYGDARRLEEFPDHSFDFILFSFNGIDYADLDGRRKILAEFSRLVRDDGAVSFSFHNKGNLDTLYSFQFPRNPFKYLWEWKRMNKVKSINGDKAQYRDRDWFIITDGGEDFMAETFYIDPIYQQQCLAEAGFRTFYFHDALSGAEIGPEEARRSQAPWIYITALK